MQPYPAEIEAQMQRYYQSLSEKGNGLELWIEVKHLSQTHNG